MQLKHYPKPRRPSRPTKDERRLMDIYGQLNGRWDQGSAEEIIELVMQLKEDEIADGMDGG